MKFINVIFAAFSAAFAGDWTSFGELLRVAWDMAWKFIITSLLNAGDMIIRGMGLLIANIIRVIRTTDWVSVGKNIMLGIGNGIVSMSGWLADQARAAANAALQAAKGFLGIHSESKEFGKLGKFAAMGFGLQFQRSMAGYRPEMAMSMSVPMASVPTPEANGISSDDIRGMQPEPINYPKLARAMRDAFMREMQ